MEKNLNLKIAKTIGNAMKGDVIQRRACAAEHVMFGQPGLSNFHDLLLRPHHALVIPLASIFNY
jgi:hypothetical protein